VAATEPAAETTEVIVRAKGQTGQGAPRTAGLASSGAQPDPQPRCQPIHCTATIPTSGARQLVKRSRSSGRARRRPAVVTSQNSSMPANKFEALALSDTAEQTPATGGGKLCSVCGETKPQDAYSGKQWSGKAHSRKCSACVANPPAEGSKPAHSGGGDSKGPDTPPPWYDEDVGPEFLGENESMVFQVRTMRCPAPRSAWRAHNRTSGSRAAAGETRGRGGEGRGHAGGFVVNGAVRGNWASFRVHWTQVRAHAQDSAFCSDAVGLALEYGRAPRS